MKLYIPHCNGCNSKIPLSFDVPTRHALRNRIGSSYFNLQCPSCCRTYTYGVNQVFAEADSNSTATGAVVGGLIGLLGGPIGALIGGGIGGIIGNESDSGEQKKIDHFNNSY